MSAIDKINKLSIKDILLITLQVVTIIFSLYAVGTVQGWDTFHVRILIGLLPFGVAIIGAWIAYTNYKTGKSERRRDFYFKYFIDSVEVKSKINFVGKPLWKTELTSVNFLYIISDWLMYLKYEEGLTRMAKITLNGEIIRFIQLLKIVLRDSLHTIEKIRDDKNLNELDKKELIHICLNKFFIGYIDFLKRKDNTKDNDLFNYQLTFINNSNKQSTKNLNKVLEELLPDEDNFYKVLGTYRSIIDEYDIGNFEKIMLNYSKSK